MSGEENKIDFEAEAKDFQGFATRDGERIEPDTPPAAKPPAAKPQTPPAQQQRQPVAPNRQQAADTRQEEGADDEGESEGEEDGEGEGQEQGKQNRGTPAEKRIAQVTRARRQAERDRDTERGQRIQLEKDLRQMQERLAALEKGGLTDKDEGDTFDPAKPNPANPKYEFGEFDAKYIADMARYEVQKGLEESQKTARTSKESDETAALTAEWEKKVATFSERGTELFDDFEDAVMEPARAGEFKISPTLGELILTDETNAGIQIAYDLAADPKEALKVFNMTPAKQAAWYGRKTAAYEAAQQQSGEEGDDEEEGQQQEAQTPPQGGAPVSKAPAPLPAKARGGKAKGGVTATTNDFAAFEQLAMAEQKKGH